MKKRTLRPEERRIWAKVAATVTPRPGRFVAQPDETLDDEPTQRKSRQSPQAKPKSTPPGLARFARQAGGQPAHETLERTLERSGEKRVRRGQVDIDARLDLHGMTQIEARSALAAFLARLRERGGRCGLVITGKGRPLADEDVYSGRGEGVLRRALPEWLAAPDLRALVAGYAPAHRRHGGEGAFYVFLKRC